MEDHKINTLPGRILGMQKLENLFNQNGYLICQATGVKIYDFDNVTAFFIPLNSETDQVMAVHSEQATSFLQKCFSQLTS